METSHSQVSLTTMLVLVACIAVNIWLFRLGALWGVVGLNVTKHIVIAQLCHALGVNRQPEPSAPAATERKSPRRPATEPSPN